MLTALLLVALAQSVGVDGGGPLTDAADAGFPPPFAAPIYGKCPVTEEKAIEVDGGWLLPTARAERAACLLASCEEDRKNGRSGAVATAPPAWVWWVTSAIQLTTAAATFGITWAASHP